MSHCNRIALKCRFSILISFTLLSNMYAVRYYVDAVNGQDANTGTSILTPWKSLEQVNQTSFLPGDSVLFKKGCVWNGILNIYSAGDAGHPIVFSSYGAGNKPLIQGGGLEAAVFIRNSASYITVDGFSLTNFDSLSVFDGAEGQRSGIQIGEWSGVLSDIKILNNEVYFIEGCSNHPSVGPPRGSALDPDYYNLYQNAGIFCHAASVDQLLIEGNYVHDCTCSGIFPFLFETVQGLVIQRNSVYNVGADGIVIIHAESPLIQLNACIQAGNNSGQLPRTPGELGFNGLAVAGIWSSICSAPVFQYNYCEGTKRIVWDGQPWDFDLQTTGNAIYQYNYSRDNEGGFNLGGAPNQVFRYNISYNDGAKQGNAQFFFNGSPTYYNNTFYQDEGYGFLINESEIQTFLNNIFYTESPAAITYQTGNTTFRHNCYHGHTPVSPGSDPVIAAPVWLNPGSPGRILPGVIFSVDDLRNAVQGFQSGPDSPCIDSGETVDNNGGIDFWSNGLYAGLPDIGAFEYWPVSTTQEEETSPVILYPNPAATTLFMQLPYAAHGAYTIYNTAGKVAQTGPLRAAEEHIDIAALASGFYLFQWTTGGRMTERRTFVKY